jgi:transcriptional regulator with XRE-family HTH domain
MEKIAINPQRLKWCCETLGITVSSLFQDVKISEATLNKAFEHQAVLSINQLEKIADYFNQSLLFFIEKTEATAENIYSPAFRTINNQQPIESRKLRKFIANVEKRNNRQRVIIQTKTTGRIRFVNLPGPVITIGDNHHNPLIFNRLTQRLKIRIGAFAITQNQYAG